MTDEVLTTTLIEQLEAIQGETEAETSSKKGKKTYKLSFPFHTIDSLRPVDASELEGIVTDARARGRTTVSFVVRVEESAGGYLFQLKQVGSKLLLMTYSGSEVARFENFVETADFINHCTGVTYSHSAMEKGLKINAQIEPADEGEEAEAS